MTVQKRTGISDLAAAKAFRARGHEVLGFEQSQGLGGVWEPSRSYPGVHTQSSKSLYRYSDAPMPAHYHEWPSGAQMHAYLEAYANKHALRPCFRFGTTVHGVQRREQPGLGPSRGAQDGTTHETHVDFVVVCTGQFRR